MLSFLQSLGKKRPGPQVVTARSDSMDSTLISSRPCSVSQKVKDSTPTTTTADTASIAFDVAPGTKERRDGARLLRSSRSQISTYNESVLSGNAKHGYRKKSIGTASRVVSGDTLVESNSDPPADFVQRSTQKLDQDWSLGSLPRDKLNMSMTAEEGTVKRRSTRLSVLEIASNVITQTRSVLGKRGRVEAATKGEKLSSIKQEPEGDIPPIDAELSSFEGPASKRIRTKAYHGDDLASSVVKTSHQPPRRPVKRWLTQGLYVGQDPDFDPRLTTARNKLKKANSKTNSSTRRSILPLPMFAGQRVMETGRNFKLPFDVFSPIPAGQPKPDEWKKTRKSKLSVLQYRKFANDFADVFVGDAAAVWRKTRLEPSRCVCTSDRGCDHSCLNRHMFYECDDTNCNVGSEHCGNRSFEGLKQRHKKGGRYNVGVEVIKTADRGYGVQSNRTFEPHQIIVEYTGEIITQDECDERMENRYKENECFYLMEFDQKMILDATRGSIARFINHSCEPNCEMIKMTVAGQPRMALFAGENGIMTGEELTYDYNFNPYSVKNVQKCRCGVPSCRGVLGPKPKEIKDALRPLAAGGKRNFQQALEDGLEAVIKKRRISVPTGVKRALSNAKEKAETLSKTRFPEPWNGEKTPGNVKLSSTSSSSTRMAKGDSGFNDSLGTSKTTTTFTYCRRRSIAALIKKEESEEAEEDERPLRRRDNARVATNKVRKYTVRTKKRSGRTHVAGRGDRSTTTVEGV
ncbi:MAG: hypothetical protein Q9219_001110 [cf. Caloplaca sp. 3 TL-2023]